MPRELWLRRRQRLIFGPLKVQRVGPFAPFPKAKSFIQGDWRGWKKAQRGSLIFPLGDQKPNLRMRKSALKSWRELNDQAYSRKRKRTPKG